jgi:hypothetical protein
VSQIGAEDSTLILADVGDQGAETLAGAVVVSAGGAERVVMYP